MVIFVLLMLIVYSSAQEKASMRPHYSRTLMQMREQRIKYMEEHDNNMRLYDELYLIRAKKHKEWLDLMENKERDKDKKLEG